MPICPRCGEDRPNFLDGWCESCWRIDRHEQYSGCGGGMVTGATVAETVGPESAVSLRWKPKDKRVRVVMTDGPGAAMPEHKGKVFALIGPFDSHADKGDLQDMLITLIRGYNLEEP